MGNVNVDLSKVNGTIANAIERHQTEISGLMDKNVSFGECKATIVRIFNEAKDNPSKKRIMANLNKQKTKADIMFYTYNLILKASKNGVDN